MKNKVTIAATLVLFTMVGATYAWSRTHSWHGLHNLQMKEIYPEGLAQRFIQRRIRNVIEDISDELELTDAQKSQIKNIVVAEQPAVSSLVQQLRAGRERLQSATSNGQFNEAQVKAIAADQGRIISDLIIIKERVKTRIFTALTPEQRAKAVKMREEFESRLDQAINRFQEQLNK
jgi:Spy/CpxP family protein refolding chaperone